MSYNIRDTTVTLPKPTVARRSVSQKWENRATSANYRPTSAPILADFLVSRRIFVEAPKLKVSLTDPPIFRGFIISEASGDGRPLIGRQSADILEILSS